MLVWFFSAPFRVCCCLLLLLLLLRGKKSKETLRLASMMEGLNSPVRLSRLPLLLLDIVCKVGEAVMLFVIGEFPVEPYVGGWVFGLELDMELRYTTPGAFVVG